MHFASENCRQKKTVIDLDVVVRSGLYFVRNVFVLQKCNRITVDTTGSILFTLFFNDDWNRTDTVDVNQRSVSSQVSW